jgi:hypothetical protein
MRSAVERFYARLKSFRRLNMRYERSASSLPAFMQIACIPIYLRALTSIPPEARNLGACFIMAAMSETEIERFKEVTLHPSSKLITRLPRAFSFIFSPYWYPEPFFIRHRKL